MAGLTNLTQLFIYENSISDISPVSGLGCPMTSFPNKLAGACRQLDSEYITCGRIKQPDRAESWEQLGIGYLGCGGINQPEGTVS